MNENLFEAQYDVTKKSKIRKFYDNNKILIYLFVIFYQYLLFIVFIIFHKKKVKK